MLKRADENIRKLIIGRILRRVVMGVGRTRQVSPAIVLIMAAASSRGGGGRDLRTEADALSFPVGGPVEVGIVEAVAHRFPDLLEIGLIGAGRRLPRTRSGSGPSPARSRAPRPPQERRKFPCVSLSLVSWLRISLRGASRAGFPERPINEQDPSGQLQDPAQKKAARRRPSALPSDLGLCRYGRASWLCRGGTRRSPGRAKPSTNIAQVDGSGTDEPMSNSNALLR